MARKSKPQNPETIRTQLVELLGNFEQALLTDDLRAKVVALVPAHHLLRDLGSSLIPPEQAKGARDRIIRYFSKYPRQVIRGEELMVVAGIGEWARRVRELRVQFGWSIASGVTVRDMLEDGEWQPEQFGLPSATLKPDDYVLLREEQDKQAAFRWNTANDIRKQKLSMKDKIISFLRQNVGAEISGEELRYVAGDKSEWARRVRELRTEEGWPVVSRNTGRPELPVGVYVLEEDRQSPAHDRKIPDTVRARVLTRDSYACQDCGWHQSQWNSALPRHLELHHLVEHAKGGENSVDNLVTLCTVCHDERHRVTKTI